MENFNTGINNLNNSIQDNNEVQVDAGELMNALNHFNWGAFAYNWLWGLGNGSFHRTWPIIILQMLISMNKVIIKMGAFGVFLIITTILLQLCFSIYYGLNGNKWAYQNRAWWSIEDYESTQRRWAIAATIIMSVTIVSILISVIRAGSLMLLLLGGKIH